MSKRAYINRYNLILKKLKLKPYSTYEELQNYIDNQLDYLQIRDEKLNMGFSKRTLQRDIKEIRNLLGVEIEYSKTSKGYFINQTEIENMNFQRMIEAFDLFNSLNLAQDVAPFIHLENRKPQGTENLYGLLHAIKNKLQIKFSYQKYWVQEKDLRIAEPYALKEFKDRWYLIAKNEDKIKSFALDRLRDLDITKKVFELSRNYNIEESYSYCFGIISANDEKPQEIILSFDAYQGKYIKSLPLHRTQEILVDNEKELKVKLKLCVTYDFVMELLSYSDTVEVLKPASLIKKIKTAHQKAFQQY